MGGVTLLLTCADGPVAGVTFDVPSCPDPVLIVRSTEGAVSILDQPGDQPEPNETVHWYRLGSFGHMCSRGTGCQSVAQLVHLPAMRDIGDARRQLELAT